MIEVKGIKKTHKTIFQHFALTKRKSNSPHSCLRVFFLTFVAGRSYTYKYILYIQNRKTKNNK